MKKTDEGFTLIELLIVIVILGILATVVVFAVGGITDRGEENACKTDKRTLETAIEAYRAQNTGYPANISDLTTAPNDFLRDEPTYFTLGASGGTVTPSGGQTICT